MYVSTFSNVKEPARAYRRDSDQGMIRIGVGIDLTVILAPSEVRHLIAELQRELDAIEADASEVSA